MGNPVDPCAQGLRTQAGQPVEPPAGTKYLSEEAHPSLVAKKDRRRQTPKRLPPGLSSTRLPNQAWLQPSHHRQRLNRGQELPVGMLLPAEN